MSDVLTRLTTALAERYRVTREVGLGGMATVYLAHDLRHERDVAIKVLHPDLAAALGASRFLAEIKTTAKLQHPHILPLLDSGEAEGLLYYVMPFVAGESLRARLERETQLGVDDAVRIAREVASALDYAHRNGVVHRDIKPENILLHEEQALVSDFGIALAVTAAGGARMTQTGLSLGTPAYMAPEQAMGERVIDGRADIYALGAVLYEMLTGEPPFTGPTVQAIVARVMTEHPRPVTGQRRSVPAHVNAAVMRALEKLPADRFSSAAVFASALVTPGLAHAGDEAASTASGRTQRLPVALNKPALAWGITGVMTLLAAGSLLSRGQNEDAQVAHLSVGLPGGMRVDIEEGDIVQLSEDGSMLAFVTRVGDPQHLVLRRLDNDSIRTLVARQRVIGALAFSPDGRWLAANVAGDIVKIPLGGGPPTKLGTANWGHLAWADGELVYTSNYDTGLRRIPVDGGDSVVFTTPDRAKGELGHWWPQLLPDGEHVLFTTYITPADRSKLEVISMKSGQRKVILNGGYFGRYTQGQLIFIRGEVALRVPFDVGKLQAGNSPVPLGFDVATDPTSGRASLAVAENGTLAYRSAGSNLIELVWRDSQGNEERAVDSVGRYTFASPSPDGRRLALVLDGDVFTYDVSRKLFTRLTQTEQREGELLWTPDSRHVIYQRDVPQFDIFKRAADGSTPEELVITSVNDKAPRSVSPDGKLLLYDESIRGEQIRVTELDRAARTSPRVVVDGPRSQRQGVFSPDGRSIAYVSNESGREEVYVTPFPVTGTGRLQVSVQGGLYPRWSPDGRYIYFSRGSAASGLARAAFNPAQSEIGQIEPLSGTEGLRGFNLGPDGRLLIARTPKGAAEPTINVVLNWAASLARQ